MDKTANCLRCGKPFVKKVWSQKYCDSTCFSKHKKELPPRYTGRRTYRRFIILNRDGFECAYCGRTSYEDGIELHVDHVVPKASGGSSTVQNLVTSCEQCNAQKNARTLIAQEKVLREVARRNEIAKIDPGTRIYC